MPVHHLSNDGKGLGRHNRTALFLDPVQQPDNLTTFDFSNGACAKGWVNVTLQCTLAPSRRAQLSAIPRHVEFADVLKSFSRCKPWIMASGDGSLCLIGTSAGGAKAYEGIGAKGQAAALTGERIVQGPTLPAFTNS